MVGRHAASASSLPLAQEVSERTVTREVGGRRRGAWRGLGGGVNGSDNFTRRGPVVLSDPERRFHPSRALISSSQSSPVHSCKWLTWLLANTSPSFVPNRATGRCSAARQVRGRSCDETRRPCWTASHLRRSDNHAMCGTQTTLLGSDNFDPVRWGLWLCFNLRGSA